MIDFAPLGGVELDIPPREPMRSKDDVLKGQVMR